MVGVSIGFRGRGRDVVRQPLKVSPEGIHAVTSIAELGIYVVPVLYGRAFDRLRRGGVETLGVNVCLDGLEFWWVWLM